MHSNELKIFFSKLADKFQKENDLSDVTWALCESSPGFKGIFLSYFFKELTGAVDVPLDREFASGESRVDFHFLFNEQCYIIEFKKADQNHHFLQYKVDFPGSHFGWIANYELTGPNDIHIRTWAGLRRFLLSKLSGDVDAATKTAIESYCEYIQKVCSLIDMKKMNLRETTSLFYFNELIRKITKTPVDDLICAPYPQSRGTKEGLIGMHFTLSRTAQPEKTIFPWFGLYYNDKKSGIAVAFSQTWCKNIYDWCNANKPEYDKLHFYQDDNCYWFEMIESEFEIFNAAVVENQERLLTAFFVDVMRIVKPHLPSSNDTPTLLS